MTREEAIKIGKTRQECLRAQKDGRCKCNLIPNYCNKGCKYSTSDEEYDEFETLAIKNLEEWEKVKEELKESSYERYFEFGEYISEDTQKVRIIKFDTAMSIIDKHLAEVSE